MATAFTAIPNPAAAIELQSMAKTATGGQVTGFELISRRSLEFALKHNPGNADPIAETHPWYVMMEFSAGRADGPHGATLEALPLGTGEGSERGEMSGET